MDTTLIWIQLAALITGFSKFSVGGMGMLILPVMMIAYPGPEVMGIIIPMYLITDLMVVLMYNKEINWPVLRKLMLLVSTGMLLGAWVLAEVDTSQFQVLISFTLIGLIAFNIWGEKKAKGPVASPLTSHTTGVFSGFIGMAACAGGPFISLYLMNQNLNKNAYISTRAWLFLLFDLAKVPLLIYLGFLNLETAALSLQAIPGIQVGAVLGCWTLSKLKFSQFKWLIRIISAIAAIKLLFWS
ncbi:MAG: sulfite exporter TauE/SafE family protein [Neptuniibacter sp.]